MTVRKGQLLVTIRNTDLEVAIEGVQGERSAVGEKIRNLQQRRRDNRASSADRERISGELEEALKKRDALNAQLKLYGEKQKKLEVTSPRDGQITTWNVYNRLIGRHVERGNVLMEVADPQGPWQLELHMPENRMGHIVSAQKELGNDLKVTFIPGTDPDVKIEGTIEEVHLAAEVRGEEGNTVLIKVKINKDDLPHEPRPGATVSAKVYCGRRSIGYVLLHDPLEFIYSRVIFRFF